MIMNMLNNTFVEGISLSAVFIEPCFKDYGKFILQSGYDGREVTSIVRYCMEHDISYEYVISKDTEQPMSKFIVPVGSVEFVETFLCCKFRPDYYPKWFTSHMNRAISTIQPRSGKWFVKPADSYKRYDGKVVEIGKDEIPSDENIFSEVVCFENEWRDYIANGEVLCSWWYAGNEGVSESDPNGPEFPKDITIPYRFCGAVDLGVLDTGELTLVEVQHPYAIGWYGDQTDNDKYVDFLVSGWERMCDLVDVALRGFG